MVAPPPLAAMSDPWLQATFDGAQAKTRALPAQYKALADFFKVDFLDAGQHLSTDGVDGIHLTPENNRALGTAIAGKISAILG